ncbi:MAG: VanZ family protein [Colwellia sp.]
MITNLIKTYWSIITLIMLIGIATLSLWPAAYLPEFPGTDKTHHFIAYAVLMLPVALRKPKYWLLVAIGFIAFSGIIELIQPYVNRYGEWLDLLANSLGVLLGIALATLLNYFNAKKTNNK